MNSVVSSTVDQQENVDGSLLELVFGLGWAAADHAHLPALPEALTHVLGVASARISVTHWNGTSLTELAFPPLEERTASGPMLAHDVQESLGTEYVLRVTIKSAEKLTNTQARMVEKAVRLIRNALECILVRQRDREALGEPFTRLSEKEWQICLALERPDGEKQIAASLACSRNTVHGYVKSVYRTLQVQSRLQVIDQLKKAREELRRRTLGQFGVTASKRDSHQRREKHPV